VQGEWEVMKPPKEPKTWKRPRLYYQPTCDVDRSRIRIIYPDGRSEWNSSGYHVEISFPPCWSEGIIGEYGKNETPQAALKAMRVHDRDCGYKPAIFCGEL